MADTPDFSTSREPGPRRGGLAAALVLGLILGGGLMALWSNYSAPQPRTDTTASSEIQANKDLQSSQQKIAGQLQSIQQTLQSNQAETKQTLAAEQAENKRLSDQITALGGKLDALQQSFASSRQPASPAPSESPPAPAKRKR
jgi:septal ring factor EnvC (AmiA/AmiB activator)